MTHRIKQRWTNLKGLSPAERENHARSLQRESYRRRRAAHITERAPDVLWEIGEIDLAYLAGLIDGEGSLHCSFLGSKRVRTCHPVIAIAMTDRSVIEWCAKLFRTSVSLMSVRGRQHLQQYSVRLSGKRAALLCARLIPYLKVKRRQAELIAIFPCDARVGPGIKIERSKINETRFRLYDEINALNLQPRNPAHKRARGAQALVEAIDERQIDN